MGVYYNENDPKAAAWLRELSKRNLIAPGEVDERSIWDVRPSDLKGFGQHHFFAGIGVWGYALRLAGWPDDRPVWTGSCPCQPFSAAGKRGGTSDERHLWPAFHHLIRELRPVTVFGEQVASRDGIAWLDTVSTDMEGEGYAIGATVLPACGFGAPHLRQRTFFVAHGRGSGFSGWPLESTSEEFTTTQRNSNVSNLAYSMPAGRPERRSEPGFGPVTGSGGIERLGEPNRQRAGRIAGAVSEEKSEASVRSVGHSTEPSGPTNGAWREAEWIYCRDGKYRPVEPGTFPLAHGAPERMGRLRGYGNAIVAQAAAEFIKAAMI